MIKKYLEYYEKKIEIEIQSKNFSPCFLQNSNNDDLIIFYNKQLFKINDDSIQEIPCNNYLLFSDFSNDYELLQNIVITKYFNHISFFNKIFLPKNENLISYAKQIKEKFISDLISFLNNTHQLLFTINHEELTIVINNQIFFLSNHYNIENFSLENVFDIKKFVLNLEIQHIEDIEKQIKNSHLLTPLLQNTFLYHVFENLFKKTEKKNFII